MQPTNTLSIAELLESGTLEMHFQPITSVRRGSVVGVEALVRARDQAGSLISPFLLFEAAEKQNYLQQLDERCQVAALHAFAPLHRAAPEMLLFVNVDAVSLARVDGKEVAFLQAQADTYGIDPRNIAVEILESRFSQVDVLKKAVAEYRKTGFLVVLDDIGAGESNLDRITQVQPDLIKVDRSLVHGIANDYLKQEVFKALVQLSERIGGWVVTEGIETLEDALTILDLGGDIVQGYYLGRPQALPSSLNAGDAGENGDSARLSFQHSGEKARQTGKAFRTFAIEKARHERTLREERLRVARCVREELESLTSSETVADVAEMEAVLKQAIRQFPLIESACTLDAHGIQLTDTVLAPGKSERQRSVVYAPPGIGSDHSLKEYVYLLMAMPLPEYETVPYVPLPNTDMCITITVRYRAPGPKHQERILCLHLLAERGVLGRDPVPKLMETTSSEMPRRHDG